MKQKKYKKDEFYMTVKDGIIHIEECPECEAYSKDIKHLGSGEGSWEHYYFCEDCKSLFKYICSDMGQTLESLELIAKKL